MFTLVVNMVDIVNIKASASALERQLGEALRDLLGSVTWLREWTVGLSKDRHWDLYASGRIPGGRAHLCVECKKDFKPNQFSGLVDRPCRSRGYRVSGKVLAMPRVSARLAELCEASGWSWFDLAGNCRLELAGAVLIERSGRKLAGSAPRSGANLGTPEASRVVRALLVPEHAGRRWTQRDIVEHFGRLIPSVPAPSLALVNKVVQHLRDQVFVEPLENRGFRVRDYEGMLKAWREAYRFERHDRRKYFTLLKGTAFEDRLLAVDPNGTGRLAYAAFSAADLQASAVRQPRTWLYLDPEFEHQFRAALDAKPVDSGENLVVLLPNDSGVFYQPERVGLHLAATNVVQTYVDVAHAGGRGEEAAEAILNRRLRPVWAAAMR
jgi:hypothetical protein